MFTQVPPKSFRSITATFIPDFASRSARDGPACPVPIMIASYVVIGVALCMVMPAEKTDKVSANVQQCCAIFPQFIFPTHLSQNWYNLSIHDLLKQTDLEREPGTRVGINDA